MEISIDKMELEQRRNIIPKSELELASIVAGDLVMISVEDPDKRRNIWTIYKGNVNGKDKFMAQERVEGSKESVVIYSSFRNTHRYDRNLGVILHPSYWGLDFVGPLRNKEYQGLVQELKEAELWLEDLKE